MHVVVIGATGNVGTAVVDALRAHPGISRITGVARRLPERTLEGPVEFVAADIERDPLDVVAGADAVVHLAWKIQPQTDEPVMRATNIGGTRRVLEAVVRAGVPAVVCASSVGTYAPSSKAVRRDESWPATGIRTCTYSRHKAEVEAMLDEVETSHPTLRVVRMRTSLVFQRRAASEVHRLFMGHLPWHLPRWARLIPRTPELAVQVTHADDIADAYVRAVTTDVRGAFNIAAEPVLDPATIAAAVGGRTVPVPLSLVRPAVALSHRLRIQPSEAGWLDLARRAPLMDVTRARQELGWTPKVDARDALLELLDGIGAGAGEATRPLHPRAAART